mmetsp:Transcript_19099/g.41357  ORF Transcript_19099/g.41357 Transcript_19099/m.41357 type:complete len:817 (+) Transcript_19099:106-2556(+)|eukprot:CAMPEP_0172316684 /NCGR_PEP_ID=MMETSP1058-20130122/29079_1 /TAXON_ID=83371 /ORGANISM="Detonula confervacea, Strain CCMP 353" /LENGTH=816 /DNA_ID=CAMNT_0013031049 /DNA_START=89 /DNA_END=2539 /DNA_ORIENTATION=+
MTNRQRPTFSSWTAIATLLLPSLTTALDPDCQNSDGSPYQGYSLKIGTDCAQYVNCNNGVIDDWLTCPNGLLYTGKVGAGGICNWAAGVTCADPGNDAPQPTPNPTPQPTPQPTEPAHAVVDNPDNWFCGTSYGNAAQRCKPCPSKNMIECGSGMMQGCFKAVTGCSSSDAAHNINDGISNSLNNNMNNIVQQASEAMNQNQNQATTIQTNRPQFDSSPQQQQQQQQQQTTQQANLSTPVPTNSPSLPPWTNAPFNPSPSSLSKTVIGYYASWQWYDRNKFADPQNIDFSKYDRINYAFFQPDANGNLFGTDEWADPQLLMGPYVYDASRQINSGPDANYFCSWDGPDAGTDRNCAHHDLKKGLVYLAHGVGVEVMPSIGGWTLSDNFPGIAASRDGRTNFANQCVGLIEAYGFDGIDIDWEYPGYEDHSGTPADTVNFTLLLQAVREALDALGAVRGRTYGLTAALPCGPDKIEKIQVTEIAGYLTEFNLMSYDMHGAWDTLTGVNAPMFDQGWTDESRRWSTHGCVNNYAELGIPMSKMNIGLSFYGRSFQKATGMKQFHGGADDINYHLDEGSPQYFNIVNELGRMTTYRHEKTQTQYAVFDEGDRGLVSYDDPRAICDKVAYANERGLHGFLIWEISGDMIDRGNGQMLTPLIDATNAKIQNPNFNCASLHDPSWALKDGTYRYAPDEPATVDWSNYVAPLSTGSANDFNGAQDGAPRPAPTPGLNVYNTPSNYVYTASGNERANNSNNAGDGISDDCPLDFTGYYPTAGCAKFVECSAGSVLGGSMPCSPGTLFDVKITACTWAEQVTCGN